MKIEEIVDQFAQKRVLVLGDVMIDAYLRGRVDRVSPEAPVPIINLNKSEERLGGAANVALNLLALGATPVLCATIGDDRGGEIFMDLLDQQQLSSEGIVQIKTRRTTIKTRVIGNNQHLIRIDEEETNPINTEEENAVIGKVADIIASGIDALIIEDYNKGLLTERVIQEVIQLANQNKVIVAVDPKKENFFAYKNVTLFKPNLKELREGLNIEIDIQNDKASFENAILLLESKLNNAISFVTLSEHGVYVKEGNDQHYIPAHVRNISDVSGAGDTVISVATLCLASNLTPKEVAEIANLAGGLVCEVSGVVPIDKKQLIEEVRKIVIA